MTSHAHTVDRPVQTPVQYSIIKLLASSRTLWGEVRCTSVHNVVPRLPYEKTNMADVPRSKEVIQKMDEEERRDYLDVYYRRGK